MLFTAEIGNTPNHWISKIGYDSLHEVIHFIKQEAKWYRTKYGKFFVTVTSKDGTYNKTFEMGRG